MNQSWFEMKDIERKRFNNAVWIPIKACHYIERVGEYGEKEYKEDFFISHSLAIPLEDKDKANNIEWIDSGMFHYGMPWINEEGMYIPAEVCLDNDEKALGIHIVLEQLYDNLAIRELYLNQDFVLALGLKREEDIWVCPADGYVEVARIKRDCDAKPYLLEVRSEYLKDYLCARKMALYLMTFRSRKTTIKDKPEFTWDNDSVSRNDKTHRWEGYITEIHEGGHLFGSEVAIFNVSRVDIDETEDVPVMGDPTDDNTKSTSWSHGFNGQKLFNVNGELWRSEWIEPSKYSPRTANNTLPPTVFFITDTQGSKENRETLIKDGRWLWFRPTVVTDIISRRGGGLEWYTAQTGSVGCLYYNYVHFGINQLGLINVYAKDIAMLPDWQQQIWAGHNVSPEGGVSSELLAAQARTEPAQTQAPEEFLKLGLEEIKKISIQLFGFSIIREHDSVPEILKKCNRFRAIDKAGLYALAKDLARVTADSIDHGLIQKKIKPPKDQKWGSLKSLENLLTMKTTSTNAREIMGPLFGIYELRLADAHLPSDENDKALDLIGIDKTAPYIHQGHMMIHSCVNSIYKIIDILKEF